MNSSRLDYEVFVSFYGIYNERIKDYLQNESTNSDLKIKQKEKLIFIEDLIEKRIQNAQEGIELIDFGRKNIMIQSTYLSYPSSRITTIFTIKIRKTRHVENENFIVLFFLYYFSKIIFHFISIIKMDNDYCEMNFVDLAGCERLNKCETGGRLTESSMIGKSLNTLVRVILTIKRYYIKINQCFFIIFFFVN